MTRLLPQLLIRMRDPCLPARQANLKTPDCPLHSRSDPAWLSRSLLSLKEPETAQNRCKKQQAADTRLRNGNNEIIQ